MSTTEALQELLDAMTATFPPEAAGQEAQTAWATRQATAVAKARAALAFQPQAPSPAAEPDAWQYRGPATKLSWAPADEGMRRWAQAQPDYEVRALYAAPGAHPAPTAQPVAIPKGYRLVPEEPTEQMFTRFSQQIETGVAYVGGFVGAYRCMLDAAPMLNGLTASETAETASVAGLTGPAKRIFAQLLEHLPKPTQEQRAAQLAASQAAASMRDKPLLAVAPEAVAQAEPLSNEAIHDVFRKGCGRYTGTYEVEPHQAIRIARKLLALATPPARDAGLSLTADARDAARYRWLREGFNGNWDVLPVDKGNDIAQWRCLFQSPYGMHDETEDNLDMAIDAAMAAATKEPT